MIKRFSPILLFYLLLFIWAILDIVEATCMEIHADEAYYQLYATHLAWGYYDHPPMIALLIRLSNLLAAGTLGVRLGIVLLHVGTIFIIWKTLHISSPSYAQVGRFFLLAFPVVMLNAYGFIATPDAPLLFFTALFFYLYKRYLDKPNWRTAALLGLTIALMIYSKYMGILVVLCVIISNIHLAKDGRLWGALGLAFILLLPHLWWQYEHHFPSLTYHLMARNSTFSILFPLEYIPNQFAAFNPVTFIFMLYAAWQAKRSNDAYQRAQAWTIMGFIAFFWVMTLKGHAEPHWTIAASIPAIALLFTQTEAPQWRKRLLYWMLPMVVLVMIARLILLTDWLPERLNFHGKQVRYERISERTGDLPVVYNGSFSDPSLFTYFTGKQSVIISSLDIRRTQFDIWQEDLALQSKPAYIIAQGRATASLQSANRLQIDILSQEIKSDSLVLYLQITNPYPCDFVFSHSEFPARLVLASLEDNTYKYTPGAYCGPDTIKTLSSVTCRMMAPYRVYPAKTVIGIQTPLCISANSSALPQP